MAQTTRPSSANGYVVNEDEFERLQLGYATDGVIGSPADTATIYADSTGRQYKIRLGKRAVVRGKLWQSDLAADEIVTTTTNTSGNPRIDRAVLRLSRTTGLVTVATLVGTPAATPAAPALTQGLGPGGTFEFPLARWTVINNYTTIAAVDILTEAWYPQGSGVILCTNTSRPFGAGIRAGDRAYETDLKRDIVWDGTQWRYAPNQTLFMMSSQAFLFRTGVTGAQQFYTSPDIIINPNEAIELAINVAWGSGLGALNGYVGVEYSVNSGGAYTQLTNLPYDYHSTTGVDWRGGGQAVWKAGSTDTKVRFRFTMNPSAGTAYDIGASNSQTNFRVWTTGKLSSEVATS